MIDLPWPDKRLNPNARTHWAALAKVKKLARAEAHKLTLAALPMQARQAIAQGEGRIALTVRFYPPDNRRRDDDNMVSSFKAYRDGIADALGVDDRRFRPHYFFEDAQKPGRVEVDFSPTLLGLATLETGPSVVENKRAGEAATSPGPAKRKP